MSWTEQAEALAEEAAETGLAIAELNAAAWSAGVDPEAVTGITGAALSLAAPPPALWARSRWVRNDIELRDAAADFEVFCGQLLARVLDLRKWVAHEYARAVRTVLDKRSGSEALASARHLMGDCQAAREILTETTARLEYAARALYRVPDDMAQVYERPYGFVAAGGALPHDGEFLTGAPLMING